VINLVHRWRVSVINGATNQVVRTIGPSATAEAGVAVDPVTNRLYVSKPKVTTTPGTDRLVVFNAGSGHLIKRIAVGKYPSSVATDPTTDTVYVGHATSGVPSPDEVIDGKTNKVIRKIGTGADPGFSVDPTTRQVFAAGRDHGPAVVFVLRTTPNGKTTKITDRIHMGAGANPYDLAVDSSNHLILVSEGLSQNPSPHNKIAVIDGTTNQIVRTVLVGVDSGAIAVDPETHIAYTCDFHDDALAILRDA
jgi:DNA-binding beta-propeller fold protein YncE